MCMATGLDICNHMVEWIEMDIANVATTITEVNYVKHYNRNGGSKAVVETVAVGADRFSTKMEARQYG